MNNLSSAFATTPGESADEMPGVDQSLRLRGFFAAFAGYLETDAERGDEDAGKLYREVCRLLGHPEWLEEIGLK